MLKQCLVYQLNTNYFTKNYFINGLLFRNHILKFHDSFKNLSLDSDFSGSEKSKDEFQDFSVPMLSLTYYKLGTKPLTDLRAHTFAPLLHCPTFAVYTVHFRTLAFYN